MCAQVLPFQQLQGCDLCIQGSFALRVYNYEEVPDEISQAPLSELFFTRRVKMLSRPEGFILSGKLGVAFFSGFELLFTVTKVRLQLIRAGSSFYMISYNPNIGFRIVDCSLYTRRIALKDDYHRKRLDMLAYNSVEFNYMETLAKTFIIAARQNQFIQVSIFNNAPAHRIANTMITNSAFT